MKEFKIRPVDVVGERRFKFLPPHIETIEINYSTSTNNIVIWIESNLKGRYYLGQNSKLKNNKITPVQLLGFEDPYESTIFLLSCPYLAKNANNFF